MIAAVCRPLGAIILGAIVLMWSIAAKADATSDAAGSFVRSMVEHAVESLTHKMSTAELRSEFRRLLHENFDVAAIGRFTLGRHWRDASADEQKEYLKLFEDLIVLTYAHRGPMFASAKFDFSEPPIRDNDVVVVRSKLLRDAPKPVRVDWRVDVVGSKEPKIIDLVIEGMSMAQTQRSEFGSVVARNGGKVSGLIEELRRKIADLENAKN
jgi:phospholipid transport system substrate-binding protein